MLRGKTILIVGGTSGLGLSAARACQQSGANLVLVGRNAEKCEAVSGEFGETCVVLAADASDPQTAERAVQAAVEQFGKLDGLYHVAGGSGRKAGDGPLDAISDEGWDFTVRLNLNSLFYSNRAAVRQFLKQGQGGTVLNMGSVLANHPSPVHFATHTYAATKAAAEGLTKACAAYYAKDSIRFNLVAPALVDTPLAQRAVNNSTIVNYIRTKQPLDGGRIGMPSDLDQTILFFLSDASTFVTGQVLAVDGGWSVSEGQLGT
ncbi:MAG: SDR family oxidoreductase [Planctomycetales bacterium]|nr:SDR family oxidoreductase [Planctomycetales bacterium]